MSSGIVDTSRDFFEDIVRPLMETHFPGVASNMACGVFGYGSEALYLDDDLSRDHHWGLRVDMLLPDDVHQRQAAAILDRVELHRRRSAVHALCLDQHVVPLFRPPERYQPASSTHRSVTDFTFQSRFLQWKE
jgi:hypothetical protein